VQLRQDLDEPSGAEPEILSPGADRPEPPLRRPLLRLVATVRALPHVLTWTGVAVLVCGFATLTYAWGKVAAVGNVAVQMPYLISGGAGGLALVVVGLALIGIAARRADAAEKSRQLHELRDVLAELRASLEEDR
jgi:NADPH:quinone reductase-like Zn-dependent oxidoreductase